MPLRAASSSWLQAAIGVPLCHKSRQALRLRLNEIKRMPLQSSWNQP